MTSDLFDARSRFVRGGKALLIVLIGCSALVGAARSMMRSKTHTQIRVLNADFEMQNGILLSWPDEENWPNFEEEIDQEQRDAEHQVLIDVLKALHDRVSTSCLVPDDATLALVIDKLRKADVSTEAVQFIQAPINSMWVRDFGPIFARGIDGDLQILDTRYVRDHYPSATLDVVPWEIGRGLGIPVHRVQVEIDGGEILSNGTGLCIVSERTDAADRSEAIQRELGAKQVVFLKPLIGEATGHVDMFATFTSPDTIVIGEYSRDYDPANSAVLDQNAARLRRVRTSSGPLKVVRIPMPLRMSGHFFTYTNVVYANGILLFPHFSKLDPNVEARALDVYRKLLPGWEIISIEATPLIKYEGSLHCLTASFHSEPARLSP